VEGSLGVTGGGGGWGGGGHGGGGGGRGKERLGKSQFSRGRKQSTGRVRPVEMITL